MSRPAKGLGRGLSALLGEVGTAPRPAAEDGAAREGVRMLPISAIAPHPDQPRRHFDDDMLEELTTSIRERGVIQPIVVRPHGHDYQIVAGERRWRAAGRARLQEIPAIVRDYDDAQTMEVALLENIQRADLNAIEEAEAYARLISQFGHTQEALGRIVHKSRSHVSNLLRLLDLPAEVRTLLADRAIEMGHARALIGVADPMPIARRVMDEGLSVRATEALVRGAKPARRGTTERRPAAPNDRDAGADADIAALERQLGDVLGLGIRIAHDGTGGSVTLTYATPDQLDMLCQRLSGEGI